MKYAATVASLLLLSLPAAAAPARPDVAQRYERAASFLETGGLTYFFFNTESVRAKIAAIRDQVMAANPEEQDKIKIVCDMFHDLGLGDAGEWGMSTAPAGDLFRSRFYLGFRNEHRGVIWSVLAPAPEKTLPGLALVPAHSLLAFGLRPDAKALADKFSTWIASTPMGPDFNQGLEDAARVGVHFMDLLRDAGNEIVVSVQLDPLRMMPTPAGDFGEPSVLIALKPSGPGFRKNLDALMVAMQVPVSADPSPVPGMVCMAADEMPPFVRPCWGESNGWFLFASHPAVYAAALERLAGKGEGLASAPEFKALSAGIPSEGSHFLYISGQVDDLRKKLMSKDTPELRQMRPFLEVILPNFALLSVTQVAGNALLTSVNSRADLFSDALLIPPVGIAAALVIPAIANARSSAERARMGAIARQLLVARMAASVDLDKVPDMEVLCKDYLGGSDLATDFEFTDAWYQADAEGADVILLRGKQAVGGKRVIGYADGHVEFHAE